MSATLDTAPIARLLGGVPVITGTGRMHAVETTYLDRPARGRLCDIVHGGVNRMRATEGDMLVFLPGSREIRETLDLLRQDPGLADRLILPLLGEFVITSYSIHYTKLYDREKRGMNYTLFTRERWRLSKNRTVRSKSFSWPKWETASAS